MTPLSRPCPACGTTSGKRHSTSGGFDWLRCRGCGSLFTGRLPTAAETAAAYGAEAAAELLDVPDFVAARLARIVAGFERYRTSGRLLDVGFGLGTLLEAARDAGWSCVGTEVSPALAADARRRGFTVVEGELHAVGDDAAGSFDVVCFVEVVEHLPDPGAYLRRASQLLRPGGMLYGTTPNGAGLTARLIGGRWSVVAAPEHLQLLSARGLRTLLARTGFRAARLASTGLTPAELLPRRGRMPSSQRVQSGYDLNEALTRGPAGRIAKGAANGVLSWTGLGDTLRFRAEAAPPR